MSDRPDLIDRDVAEEALHASEARYRTLVEQIPVIVYEYADDEDDVIGRAPHRLAFVSSQIELLLGITPEEWRRGGTALWAEMLHPDDRDRVTAGDRRAHKTGGVFREEYRMVGRGGQVVWIRDEARLLRDEASGEFVWHGVVVDITDLMRVESALRESEGRYRDLVQLSPDAILIHADGRFVYANDAAVGLLGADSTDQLVGMPVMEIVHPDFREVVANRIRQEVAGRPVPLIEEKFIRLDGDVIDVEVAGMPVTINGQLGGQIVVRDVTLRKRAEVLRRDTEARYRALVEQIPAVVYVYEETGPSTGEYRTAYVSPQIERMLGYPKGSWVEDDDLWMRTLDPRDRDGVLAEDARTQEAGEDFNMEYRKIASDGRVVWVHERAALVRDEPDQPRLWQGVMFDITELKEAEASLREAEARYRTLVEQIPAVTYAYEYDPADRSVGRTSYVSPQIESILGYSVEEWQADDGLWDGTIDDRDRERVVAEERRTAQTGEPFAGEYRRTAADGRVVWVREQSARVRTVPGELESWHGVMFDITELKRAELELRESMDVLRRLTDERRMLLFRLAEVEEEERARLAADIHDDPIQKMTAVGLRLETLRRQLDGTPHQPTLAQLEETVRMAIGRLRHLMFELRPPALDRDGLAAALDQYLSQLGEETELETTLSNRLVSEPGRETRIIAYRVAQEALANVRKHSDARHVEVMLEEREDSLVLRVRDDGVGFSPDEALQSTPGHLGLSSIRERAELAGGSFMVESTPGSGTTVEVRLPTDARRESGHGLLSQASPPPPSSPAGSPGHPSKRA